MFTNETLLCFSSRTYIIFGRRPSVVYVHMYDSVRTYLYVQLLLVEWFHTQVVWKNLGHSPVRLPLLVESYSKTKI